MRPCAILIALALLSGCAHTDGWDRKDTMYQLGVTAVLAGDAYTTMQMQYAPGVQEGGPIAKRVLGLEPSTEDTLMYFASIAISNYFISRVLPRKWRRRWQTWEMTVHGYSIARNCDLGLCE